MKTLFKILVIFVVAILVGGMFYGAVTATSSNADQASMSERPARADGEFTPHDGEDGAGGLQFPADAVKNLAIISIISVIYLNVPRLFGRKKSTVNVVS